MGLEDEAVVGLKLGRAGVEKGSSARSMSCLRDFKAGGARRALAELSHERGRTTLTILLK